MTETRQDISIVLVGSAGTGIQTIENILSHVFKQAGYNIFATKEVMSRVRGGMNSTTIRISSYSVTSYSESIDILLAIDHGSIVHVQDRLHDETVIIGDNSILETDHELIDVPILKIATDCGGKIYSNTVITGIIAGMLKLEISLFTLYIQHVFREKDQSIIDNNIQAVKMGYEKGIVIADSKNIPILQGPDEQARDTFLINGTESIALGAIAGGCNFISSYPMSPSTGVLIFLSQNAKKFGIIVDQAEDEISAINMALGAWYAGGRAMVTTSGGGFALMEEGVSLAGIIETPVVIHIAQRPGPGTGLPTRTEQGDLELALYSGHGEFPRIILAPGTVHDAFSLSQAAFNIADRFQIPVFILSDQYFLDTYVNVKDLDLNHSSNEYYITRTSENYVRYKLTDDGISPRGIPDFGDGLVCVDSDEHDERSQITESSSVRKEMMDKRLKKMDLIKKEIIAPVFHGNENYRILLVCWGSTYPTIKNALEILNRDDVAMLYFKQVYPLSETVNDYFSKAPYSACIENNATGQFAKIVQLQCGHKFSHKILKYDGKPFSVEGITEEINNLIQSLEKTK